MPHIKRIKDPVYLSKQTVVDVPEHQVRGLLNHIRAMIIAARQENVRGMVAPEAGLDYNFFVAGHANQQRNPDWDTVFSPSYTPYEDGGTIVVEEVGVDGETYQVERWRKIHMTWKSHNGQVYSDMEEDLEGPTAYLGQIMCDRLAGIYVGAEEAEEGVTSEG